MRVIVVSHSYVLTANRGKLEALARIPGLELLTVVPRRWSNRDLGQRFHAEHQPPGLLTVVPLPAWSLGSGSLIAYGPVSLRRVMRRFRPDLVHLEEEPWSLAALELAMMCGALGVPLTLFTWENTGRRLSLPFRLIRRVVLDRARAAVAGNTEAKERVGDLGFPKSVTVLPQLGVDASAFQPAKHMQRTAFIVGYVGRLVPQKGLLVLLEAAAQLPPEVRLRVVGIGPLRDELMKKARALNIHGRLEVHEGVAHRDVARYLQQMTVLVLPSLTSSTWKEQFGHVLIEAMACGVPVVGSDSGAIPEVIGDAGIVVPEGQVDALATALRQLIASPELRVNLAARGRARVLTEYTNDVIAHRLAAFWSRSVTSRP